MNKYYKRKTNTIEELNFAKGNANRGKLTWNKGLKYNKYYSKFTNEQKYIWNKTQNITNRLNLLKSWNIE